MGEKLKVRDLLVYYVERYSLTTILKEHKDYLDKVAESDRKVGDVSEKLLRSDKLFSADRIIYQFQIDIIKVCY